MMRSDEFVLGAMPGEEMNIVVRTADGKGERIPTSTESTVSSLTMMLERRTGTPWSQQRLIHSGRLMEDSRKVSDYGVEEGTVFQLMKRKVGGGLDNPEKFADGRKRRHSTRRTPQRTRSASERPRGGRECKSRLKP